jgi:putative ABC transport system ATP-binding protein
VEVLGNRLEGAQNRGLVEVRRRLGFIFQSHNLHPSLSAMQNVRMGLELHGGAAMMNWRQAAAHMLTSLGLGTRLDYLPSELSGGQKQRVAVARALVGNPEIVFADEPTAALDGESGRKVVDILKELGRLRGTTSLVVTHDQRVLERADRVVTLDSGRIIDDVRRP